MKSKGFMVTYCPGLLSGAALAECALMFMLMLARDYKRSQESFKGRIMFDPTVGDLEGSTLLILGFGGSGQVLAKRAKNFGMQVWALDVRRPDQEVIEQIQPDFVGSPEDPNLPVYQLPNVLVSPHNAGVTYGTARKRNRVMVENIVRFAEGRELLYRIDQERPE